MPGYQQQFIPHLLRGGHADQYIRLIFNAFIVIPAKAGIQKNKR